MRIVDRKTFESLPAGTLYQNIGTKKEFDLGDGPLTIKGPTWPAIAGSSNPLRDFNYLVLQDDVDAMGWDEKHELIKASIETGSEFPMNLDGGMSRDGWLTGENQLFAVWSLDDMDKLIKLLHEARLKLQPPEPVSTAYVLPALQKLLYEHEGEKLKDGLTLGVRFADKYLGKTNLLYTTMVRAENDDVARHLIMRWLMRSGYREHLPLLTKDST